ncbi:MULTISPECIES: hypothetical protein [Cupriavidus]|uniref:Uncharacterized protein n=1 Tax=Cupriavidus pinatubonensis (strain JMP 134 / LMG 1197) TaxID=264198 RepID=Q475R0_CUPPJ|nr:MULTISPECIES: hypothetical protein [Cupriavidus]QYY32097.1 hypothetical protein K2O51_14945 [Cupriavidus pinatubonensis]TPQ43663.1 hypothetical protein C2U69_01945 [Cupriavidus pinatubonensis]
MIGWLRRLFPGNTGTPHNPPVKRHVDPSEPFVINLYDDRVVVHRPDGQREEVMWDTLERVVVRVSNAAPWAGKVWLILIGAADSGQGCVTPMDAANATALLERLQALPGFNQQKLDNALRDASAGKSRSDAVCWKRGAQAEPASDINTDRSPGNDAGRT